MARKNVPITSKPAGLLERRAPVRTCVGCRQRAAKHEVLRVVARSSDSGHTVEPDPAGRAPGRGAHLHPTAECLTDALRRRAFPRALRIEGRIDVEPLVTYVQEAAHPPG